MNNYNLIDWRIIYKWQAKEAGEINQKRLGHYGLRKQKYKPIGANNGPFN
jgi:hypothetical protein